MAVNLTPEELYVALRSRDPLEDPFRILRSIATHVSFADESSVNLARDFVIQMLNRRAELNGYSEVVDSLAIAVGLYPYAETGALGAPELLAYEAHRPVGFHDEELVFHQAQATVYEALMDGESVILSAPTSFGKSLVVDALVASGRFTNIAIVVPTIALIDETRRRLSGRFSYRFKVVTHPSQTFEERNLIVMTQERLLDVEQLPDLDLFVIDEFYKLDPTEDRDRANLLNQAFYRLKQTGAQFYLLGPNIKEMPVQLNTIARVILTDFSTVSLDVRQVDHGGDPLNALIRLCSQLEDPTLVYCRSPNQARSVALALAAAEVGSGADDIDQAVTWIGRHYHPEWSFVTSLEKGIGLHHGRIPRSLGQYAVRSFNSGRIRFLVCTSTLIEGVNTTAKNVVIYDDKISNKRFDYFTFNNIKGRSGRMFTHFVGHVYLFHPPPEVELPSIDVPVITQPDSAQKSLLIHLADEDLSDRSRDALADLLAQSDVPMEDLRKSSGIDPELLVALARRLRSEPATRTALAWYGYPSWQELRMLCDIVWEDLRGKRSSRDYVRTAPQLTYRLNRLRSHGIAGLIELEIDEHGDADKAVEDVLDFCRHWAGFHFPRLAMAVERTHERVARELGEAAASYSFYVASVESLFLPASFVALEEYGIPLQLSVRLNELIGLEVSLDEAIAKIRQLDLANLTVDPFEREVLTDAQQAL